MTVYLVFIFITIWFILCFNIWPYSIHIIRTFGWLCACRIVMKVTESYEVCRLVNTGHMMKVTESYEVCRLVLLVTLWWRSRNQTRFANWYYWSHCDEDHGIRRGLPTGTTGWLRTSLIVMKVTESYEVCWLVLLVTSWWRSQNQTRFANWHYWLTPFLPHRDEGHGIIRGLPTDTTGTTGWLRTCEHRDDGHGIIRGLPTGTTGHIHVGLFSEEKTLMCFVHRKKSPIRDMLNRLSEDSSKLL